MANRRALRELAARVGILAEYTGTDDRRRTTSDATRAALLASLGFDVSGAAAARRSLDALRARQREPLLDAAGVAPPGRPARVPLRLGGRRPARVELEILEESGAVRELGGRSLVSRGGLRLPALPAGLHRLRLRVTDARGTREAEQALIVSPRRCTTVRELLGRRRGFGLWTHLYALRGARDLGVGDLTDLSELARFAGRCGAEFVGLQPLHALRNRGGDTSPYSPMSRLFRNPIYLDVEAVPEFSDSEPARRLLEDDAARRAIAALRRAPRVDYARVARLKRRVLEALHAAFRASQRGRAGPRQRAYAGFCGEQGELLGDFAGFAALEEHLARRGHPRDWRRWPAVYRDPRSAAVREFRARHADAVDFHRFLQFELDRQLAAAARAARDAGLAIGLYHDLALGSAASSFDAWAFPGLFVPGATLGAPPDEYAAQGQDWGIPPVDPSRLRADGFRYWVRLLRAAFAHAGALRIDHVMGLFRQFWIPEGAGSAAGAYLRQPAPELLALLALESRRQGALVVGEDLGTVPRGLPAALARAGVLSSRVLLFERNRRGAFKPARSYSPRALVSADTHDLPTLAGFWSGRDLEIRRAVGVIPDDRRLVAERRRRELERDALRRRLVRDGLLARGVEPTPPELCAATGAFLCRTPSPLVAVSVDDLAGEVDPLNIPGVSPERYPSWTRRMRIPVERLARDPGVQQALRGTRARVRRAR